MTKAQPAPRPSLPLWSRMPLAIGTGVLMGLGMAPYDLWYLGFLGYVLACWLFLAAPRGLYVIGTGWAIGLGYFGFALGWIIEPFFVDAKATGWMAPFALFGMGGGMAIFWAMAFWLAAHAKKRPILALVIAWTGAELARAYVFTGFPWAMVSYLWASVAPIQWVSLIGPHGLTLLTLSIAAIFAAALHNKGARLLPLVLGSTALLSLFAIGWALTPQPQDITDRPMVRLIQPNAPQHQKWDPQHIPKFFQRQLAYTAADPQDDQPAPALIIWPETAIPNLLHRAGDMLGTITHAAGQAPVIVGMQRYDAGQYFNSLVLMGADGDLLDVYDKHHLVPFGEYMPAADLFKRWNIAGLAQRAEGGYTPGPGPAMLTIPGLGKALPLICYEAVFPQDVHAAPERADVLLQITNDAWFGQWSGPYQHLAQARIRAIEQGLPMIRVANTGVSAMIDGAGRVMGQIPLEQAGFIDLPLPAPLRETFYSFTGDLPILLLLFLSTFNLFLPRRLNPIDGTRQSA